MGEPPLSLHARYFSAGTLPLSGGLSSATLSQISKGGQLLLHRAETKG
ncbi:hypothetical protein HDF14_002760 [Edaphobacter lichenicola]|uniref:Uncharacterized protein n=1 Tax=Tunturiibacter gelidiferens TaxID=3069689 RepID=A0A9X0QF82_9BACT|nr:hypothetical protein [Edaphobacter lichenicola]